MSSELSMFIHTQILLYKRIKMLKYYSLFLIKIYLKKKPSIIQKKT